MFTLRTTIQLHHTDAAGVVFFGHFFALAHDAYQAFMQSLGFGLREIIDGGDFLLPIVHAEAEFLQPVRLGEEIEIRVHVERVGDTSFVLRHELAAGAGTPAVSVRTVHVAIDRHSREKKPLPEALRAGLSGPRMA